MIVEIKKNPTFILDSPKSLADGPIDSELDPLLGLFICTDISSKDRHQTDTGTPKADWQDDS
ncbi:MAG: hypothetical protein RLZZ517_223 [Candidatus Parcubacteria bacterium]|jgi:hypothetical protein